MKHRTIHGTDSHICINRAMESIMEHRTNYGAWIHLLNIEPSMERKLILGTLNHIWNTK